MALLITVCCVCKKVKNGNEWAAFDQISDQKQVSHGYCPLCCTQMMEKSFGKNWREISGFNVAVLQ